MRVLTFVHSFELGGVERIALRLVRRWRELGIDAPLFVGRIEGAMRAGIAADLDFVTPAPTPIPTARWETLWMICMLPGVVRRLRPDVLFCPGNSYTVVAVALKLLLGRKCPPILAKISNSLDRRDVPQWQRWPYRLWLRIHGRFLDHAVGMEAPMAEEICEGLRLSADRVTIVPDPALSQALIDRLRAIPRAPSPVGAGRRFVAVGRLAPQKNFALMLRAFHRGAAERDLLAIIGEGPERVRLTRLANAPGLGERVVFRGFLPEPAAILRQYDVLLLSSDYEGVPAVILEALAAGLPIVATNCCRSMSQLLQHGALGQLIGIGDEAAFAAAIAGASPAASDDRLSLAQARRFTIEQAGDAYAQALRRLVSRAAEQAHAAADAPPPALPHPIGKTIA